MFKMKPSFLNHVNHMGRDIITKTFNCESCGHIWRPMLWLLPKTCPGCGSPDWDIPRRWHEK